LLYFDMRCFWAVSYEIGERKGKGKGFAYWRGAESLLFLGRMLRYLK